MKSVVLAPRYADSELRSLRSLESAKDVFGTVDVFWSPAHSGNHHRENGVDDDVRDHYVGRVHLWHLRSILGLPALDNAIATAIRGADCVYIHDGGVEGLLLARSARRLNSDCCIVFDYHDSISFELFYQLKKRRLESLFNVFWRAYRLTLPKLSSSIDAVVGISVKQVEDFFHLTGRSIDAAVIPNFREFTLVAEPPQSSNESDEVSLVWIGQVMRGRDLECIANWTRRMGSDTSLHVFGRVLDDRVEAAVQETLGDRIRFHGGYQSDSDIRASLPSNAIGVFLGWEDPARTGINGIASPNKYYSYVNLELPLILGASLEGLSEDCTRHGAGVAIDSYSEFVAAVDQIRDDYRTYSTGTRKLKTEYRALDLRSELADLLRRVAEETQR